MELLPGFQLLVTNNSLVDYWTIIYQTDSSLTMLWDNFDFWIVSNKLYGTNHFLDHDWSLTYTCIIGAKRTVHIFHLSARHQTKEECVWFEFPALLNGLYLNVVPDSIFITTISSSIQISSPIRISPELCYT